MNSNEILNKYIDLIDKGYCSNCNELNCIDNFPHSKITHAIRELQQENKRLKDNWNKLEEWVNKQYDYYMNNKDYIGGRLCFTDMKDKIQELEQGSDSNE